MATVVVHQQPQAMLYGIADIVASTVTTYLYGPSSSYPVTPGFPDMGRRRSRQPRPP